MIHGIVIRDLVTDCLLVGAVLTGLILLSKEMI